MQPCHDQGLREFKGKTLMKLKLNIFFERGVGYMVYTWMYYVVLPRVKVANFAD